MSQSGYTDYYRDGGAYPPPPSQYRPSGHATTYEPDPRASGSTFSRHESIKPTTANAMAPYDEGKAYANYYDDRDRDYRSEPPRRRGSRGASTYDDRTEYDDRRSYDDDYYDEPPRRHSRGYSRSRSRSRLRSRSRSYSRADSRPRSRSRGFFNEKGDKIRDKKEKHEDIIAGVIGAGAGGFLGNRFAGGKIGTIGGAVLGGIAAEEWEKHRQKKRDERGFEGEGRYPDDGGSRRRSRSRGRYDYEDDRYSDRYDEPPRDYGRRSRSRSIVDKVKRSLSRSKSRGRNDFYDDDSRY